MRIFCCLFLFLICFSLNATECPNFEGQWTCNDQSSETYNLTITQILKADVTQYEFTSDDYSSYYQADGIQYPYGVNGAQGTIQTTCVTSSKVNVFIRLSKPSYAEFNYNYTLSEPNSFHNLSTFYFHGQAPMKVEADCVKIK